MPFTTLLQRLKLRHKIAALGVVGMALCMLPLIQLLRYQGLELQWMRTAQDRLEPAVLAVDVQRGLVDHRASAAQWLRGRNQAEAQRRQHQAQVDARLAMLDHRLATTEALSAQTEVTAMRGDWLRLVQRVVERQCSVSDSDGAHRLLIEQVLQVIDTVTAAAAALPHPGPSAGMLREATAQARAHLQTPAPDWPAAAQVLATAQAQVLQAQARQLRDHGAKRQAAAATLLALGLAMALLLARLWRATRPLQALPPDTPGPAHAGTWQAPAADGQQAGRSARLSLLQRLRQPAPEAPRLDQPTEPREL